MDPFQIMCVVMAVGLLGLIVLRRRKSAEEHWARNGARQAAA